MNNFKRILAALPLLFALAASHAAAPAGAVIQLSGFAMAIKPDGRARVVSAQSKLEVGDTLVSEADSFVQLRLDDGNEAILGPSTSLKVERLTPTETALSLTTGVVHVTGTLTGPVRRFTIAAGENLVDAGSASFILTYVLPAPGSAVALRRLYLRSSLAALSSGVVSDAGGDLGDLVAQNTPVAPKPVGAPALQPGLYISVLDGAISLSNKGGSQSFTAGQFGYTANVTVPPVLVPANPALKFTPPPTFASTTNQSGGSKTAAVDCVVR